MGRKGKKKAAVDDDTAAIVWCWYCDREFSDEKILIQHQRAKHFKCPHCSKRMVNAPGMAIHCSQMHKEELREVPNSIPGRSDPGPMISGMTGIPEEDLNAHVFCECFYYFVLIFQRVRLRTKRTKMEKKATRREHEKGSKIP